MSENKNLDYFKGDQMAADVWQSKYAAEGETSPDEMHHRMAKEFARIEDKYYNDIEIEPISKNLENLSEYGRQLGEMTEDYIYNLFKDFKYIVPQGSIMYGLGRKDKYISLSNCFFIGKPVDSYGGIMQKDEELVQLMKRR